MSPSSLDPEDVPEAIFALFTHGEPGGDRYQLSGQALSTIEMMLKPFLGTASASEALMNVFRVAHLLDKKLESPTTARELLMVGAKLAPPSDVFKALARKGAVDEQTWNKLLGSERGLPEPGKKKKTGKFPWELIGSD